MEKEKILQQLEEKLLPFVQNLENGQASDHDFFPALLWMLLQKSKDSDTNIKATASAILRDTKGLKTQLEEIAAKNREDIAKTVSKIIQSSQEDSKKYEEKIVELNAKNELLLKKITEHFNQKIESIKNWLYIFFALHTITLILLAVILVKK